MFRRGLVWLSIASAPLIAACSLLLDDGFANDGVSPSDSGTGSDTTTSGGDGSPIGPDGSNPPIDGSLPTFDGGKLVCADAAGTFCDDFEHDDPQGPWSGVSVNEAGTIAIGKAPNGSRRLEAAILAVDGIGQVYKDITVTPQRIHIEVTLEILSLPTSGAAIITGATMLNPGNPVSLFYLYAHGGGAFVVEQLTDGAHYVQTPLAITLNAPHRIVLDVVQGGKVTVTIDGASQVDKSTEPWLVLKPPQANLGAGTVNGCIGFSMRADDYVFIAE